MRKHIERIERSIEYLFYALFAVSPLAMHPYTSELFEFNKMWLVFIFSLVIFFLWSAKIILLRRFEVRRTFFDIPLMLFLLSQVISTIISIDPHTSLWGYYSRWNGGLLSTISYIFLYYAFTTNVLNDDHEISVQKIYNTLTSILLSAFLVSIWGLPSHFGYDPTCLVFRGTFDVACWTDAFKPEVRMFSTLGQPNWLGTFLAIILPITVALILLFVRKLKKSELLALPSILIGSLSLLAILMYLDLSWTLSQSGFVGFWSGSIVFGLILVPLIFKRNNFSIKNTLKQKTFSIFILINILFLVLSFLTTVPIGSLTKYTLSGIQSKINLAKKQTATTAVSNPAPSPSQTPEQPAGPALEASITGSGDIRKIVWKGAIEIFKANPLIGTGVETFAWAYYKHRPVEHNLNSEWDYLYNKAHNEFLNYLATTGLFGLGTYLSFIFSFLFYAGKVFFKQLKRGVIGNPLLPALVGSFFAIQISNFFGFSVVNVNLLMFFIPIFFFALTEKKTKMLIIPASARDSMPSEVSAGQIMGIVGFGIIALFNITFLINFWYADIDYAWGSNYQQRAGDFATANSYLEKAVQKRPGEDLFNNELSVNLASIALNFAEQKDQQNTALYGTRAKELSDKVASRNPNNVVYWKARTRVLFSLAQINASFLPEAMQAIETAIKLAPTDAKILYNKALIYDQAGQHDIAFDTINKVIKLKPNYRDAYYAKALFYKGLLDQEKSAAKIAEYKKSARESLNFTLTHIDPNDTQSQTLLKALQ